MGKSNRKMRAVLVSAAGAAAFAGARSGEAATYFWRNATSTWEAGGTAWSATNGGAAVAGFPSGSADIAAFNQAYAGQNPNLTAGESISQVSIVGTSGTFYTFSGSALSLGSTGNTSTTSAIIDRATGGTNVFNNNVVLSAANNSTQTFFTNSGTQTLTMNGVVSSTNANITLALLGTGVVNLNNSANSYAGGTNIGGSTVNFVSGALGTTGNVFFTGGTLGYVSGNTQDLSARIVNSTSAVNIDVGGNAVAFASALASSNTGGLVAASTGGGGSLSLNAANSYSGGTTLSTGILLNLGNSGALGTSGGIVLAGSSSLNNTSGAGFASAAGLSLTGGSLTFVGTNSLTLNGSSALAGNTGTNRTISVTNNVLALNGNIGDSGTNNGITKSGTGTLALGGNNAFTNGVAVSNGQLNINSNTALGVGGTLTMSSVAIDNTSASVVTVSNPMSFSAASTVTFVGSTNDLILNGNATLLGNATIAVNARNLTLGGTVSGTGFALTKSGGGTLTLRGNNTFSGGVNVTAGTVNFNSAGAAGTGGLALTAFTTIDNTSGAGVSLSTTGSVVNSSGNGINAITFTGTNALTVGGSTVVLSTTQTNTINGSILAFSGVLTNVNNTATSTPIFTANGTGTLALGGFNLSTAASVKAALGGSATINITGPVTQTNAATLFTYNGPGTLILGGTNTYSAATSIAAGTVRLNSTSAFGASTAVSEAVGATLDLNGVNYTTPINITGSGGLAGNLTNSSATAANYTGDINTVSTTTVDGVGDITLSGNISGASGAFLTKNGNNILTLAGNTINSTLSVSVNSGTLILAKTGATAVRGGGGLVINGGLAQLGGTGGNQLLDTVGGNATAPVAVNNGTFDINTRNETVGNLTLGTSSTFGTITGSTGVLSAVVAPNGNGFVLNAGAVGGILGGSSALTKQSAQAVTLSASNSYTGATNVTAGTLDVALGGGISGSTNVSVTGGGVLELDTGSVALNTLTTVSIDTTGGASTVFLNYTGTETVVGLILNGAAQANGVYDFSNTGGLLTGSGSLTVVTPEPTCLSLMALGGGAMLARRRRTRTAV